MDEALWKFVIKGLLDEYFPAQEKGVFANDIQRINMPKVFDQEDLKALGNVKPYFRYITYPPENGE